MRKADKIHYNNVSIEFDKIDKFKELRKEEVEGTSDAFLLFVTMIQCDEKYIEWDEKELKNELGFNDEYLSELMDFLIELGCISINK